MDVLSPGLHVSVAQPPWDQRSINFRTPVGGLLAVYYAEQTEFERLRSFHFLEARLRVQTLDLRYCGNLLERDVG